MVEGHKCHLCKVTNVFFSSNLAERAVELSGTSFIKELGFQPVSFEETQMSTP